MSKSYLMRNLTNKYENIKNNIKKVNKQLQKKVA